MEIEIEINIGKAVTPHADMVQGQFYGWVPNVNTQEILCPFS